MALPPPQPAARRPSAGTDPPTGLAARSRLHLLAPQHKLRGIALAALVFTRVAKSVVHADNASTVSSEPADAPTGDAGGDNAKEEFPDLAGPWLNPHFQNRCALGFEVYVVRGTFG